MRIAVLIDNDAEGGLKAEWGLSLWVEYEGRRILLDTGASPAFAENAAALGLDLAEADFGVLSHAHYDHADGMAEFFRRNHCAPFYLREACREDCYGRNEAQGLHYIGIAPGTLEAYAGRIVRVSGRFSPDPGITLLGHSAPGLSAVGAAAALYRKTPQGMAPDGFDHEQSMILETPRGLVVMNSCCHAGADVILREAEEAFPGRPLYAIVGGFHLHRTPPDDVRAFAGRLRDTGVQRIVTGHCTGQAAFGILREELGEAVLQTRAGLVLEL